MSKRNRSMGGYKQGQFTGYGDYRYGSDTPISLPKISKAKPILSQGRRQNVVSVVEESIADYRRTPFEREGVLKHSLRSQFCLEGFDWKRSDAEASIIVDQAIGRFGIPRPSWDEGQHDYAESPDRCSWCGDPVEDSGNGKARRFCSSICAQSAFESREYGRRDETDKAFAAAKRALKRSKTTVRTCEECTEPFQPVREKSSQRFCSFSCGAKNRSRRMSPASVASMSVTMACLYCHGDFPARSKKALFCSKPCTAAYDRLKKGIEPTRLQPRVFDRYVVSAVGLPAITADRFDFAIWQAGGPPPGSGGIGLRRPAA